MKIETTKKQVGVLRYNDYLLDIIQDNEQNIYEFWLYKDDYGVKMHCIGIEDLNLEIIQNNINKWIDFYNNNYANI